MERNLLFLLIRTMFCSKHIKAGVILILFASVQVCSSDDGMSSYHYGLFHPNGLDVYGYSVETKISEGIYRFYSLGIPSGAAIGISYYQNYEGDGISATASAGLATLFAFTLAYQIHLDGNNYIKLGAGYTENLVYAGPFSVISYEQRFKE